MKDRIVRKQRIARKLHLGYQPCHERWSEEREVNMCRPPGIVMVPPRIGPGLHGYEFVAATSVGHDAPGAREVRIERSLMIVFLMGVSPGRISLPDLDESV